MLPVVLENTRLCVVDKPGGWLSVPSRLGAADPRPCVGLVLQEQLGCNIMQGFLFKRAVPADELERWLEESVLPRRAPWFGAVGDDDSTATEGKRAVAGRMPR